MKPETSRSDRWKYTSIPVLLVVFCLALLVVGCSTETKYKWLSRFFDGVPAPGSTVTSAGHPDEETVPLMDTNAIQLAVAAKPVIAPTMHPPYHDGNCTECHESKFSQKMKGQMNTVCFSCHDDFFAKAKVKHPPAEDGECASCHDPHESPNKKLLVRVGAALCLECHEKADMVKVKAHKDSDQENCTSCHDPHASDFKKLLTAAAMKKLAPKPPEPAPAAPTP